MVVNSADRREVITLGNTSDNAPFGRLSELVDGYEPPGTIQLHGPDHSSRPQGGMVGGRGRGVPGVVGGWVGTGRAIPVPNQHPPGPIFNLFPGRRPYPRPNEGNSRGFHEVSQKGSRIDLRIDQN